MTVTFETCPEEPYRPHQLADLFPTMPNGQFRELVKDVRAQKQAEKKVRRQEREQQLAAKITALPDRRYGVIYGDPEWTFEVYSEETGMDRAAANHYPTSSTDEIASRDVPSIAADDCILFLWATAPNLPDALRVMAAWGNEAGHFGEVA